MFSSKKIALAFFVFVAFGTLYHFSLLSFIDPLLRGIITPIQANGTALAQTTGTELSLAFSSKRKLLEQVRELELRSRSLTEELLSLQKVERENEELRALLNFEKEPDRELVLSRIIHISNTEGERIIILDKGANAGIEKGDPVISGGGGLIGKVLALDEYSSRVRLTIDSKSAVLATVYGSANTIAGIARGLQGRTIQLELIPKNIPLSPGMIVYTNGLEEKIPRALFIGEIAALEKSENEIFNTASLVPPYSIENLTVAGVITNP